jgi:hypothetical protein
MLNTRKARAYKPAFQPLDNIDFKKGGKPIYKFDPMRVTIQKNIVFKGAKAILIDDKVVSLKDSYSALTEAVSRVHYGLTISKKVEELYDQLSGKEEGENFWITI